MTARYFTSLGQLLAAVADHPRSQSGQDQRNVMSEAVTFVSSRIGSGRIAMLALWRDRQR